MLTYLPLIVHLADNLWLDRQRQALKGFDFSVHLFPTFVFGFAGRALVLKSFNCKFAVSLGARWVRLRCGLDTETQILLDV